MKKYYMKILYRISMVALVVACAFGLAGIIKAATTVGLGTAEDFAVLAGSAISDTTTSVISGDVGLDPTGGTAITELTCAEVTGTIYDNNNGYTGGNASSTACLVTDAGLLTAAKNDLTLAYDDAKGQTPTGSVTADLGGQTLQAGVYKDNGSPASLAITGTLTLDAEGDPDAVFIFQSESTLITASDSVVNLVNEAQACNVFWQVGSSATLGTNSDFAGNILALASITDDGGSTVDGRLLARNGAVTLNDTAITVPGCTSAANLHVIKVVVNENNDGTAVSSDFTVYVQDGGVDVTGSPSSGASSPGTSYSLSSGTYIVSEDLDASYVQSFSGDCDSEGSIKLSAGDDKTCTITNTDIETSSNSTSRSSSGRRSTTSTPIVSIATPLATTSPIVVTSTTGGQVLGATTPGLPNTGFPPQEKSTPWDIAILAGILVVLSFLYSVLRKQTNW